MLVAWSHALVYACVHLYADRRLTSYRRTTIQSSIMRGIGAGVRIFDLLDRQPAIPPETGVEVDPDRKSTRLNSSHSGESRMPSSA